VPIVRLGKTNRTPLRGILPFLVKAFMDPPNPLGGFFFWPVLMAVVKISSLTNLIPCMERFGTGTQHVNLAANPRLDEEQFVQQGIVQKIL
jgi:hypothetical protein